MASPGVKVQWYRSRFRWLFSNVASIMQYHRTKIVCYWYMVLQIETSTCTVLTTTLHMFYTEFRWLSMISSNVCLRYGVMYNGRRYITIWNCISACATMIWKFAWKISLNLKIACTICNRAELSFFEFHALDYTLRVPLTKLSWCL